ncbi:hypothetical protein DAEQUDRAFT_769142 [Daedalea quercina L-15889]|uniref:Uncharacterized protein n=1 Tax=Daedalea quercina L-15889 TaxID=1314783 RepID=A0A165M0V2_9APHY|nr:hypothetical protein DAEQUDRAFT_769142 [Daedalea quercina L-15889]
MTVLLPSDITIAEVQQPTDARIDEAAALTDALQEAGERANINLRMLTPPVVRGVDGRELRLMRAIIKASWLCAGVTYVATDAHGALAGYSQWIPPGRDLFDS